MGVSQTELAARLGLVQGHVSNLENGIVANIRLSILAAWADELDMRIEITVAHGTITARASTLLGAL